MKNMLREGFSNYEITYELVVLGHQQLKILDKEPFPVNCKKLSPLLNFRTPKSKPQKSQPDGNGSL